MPMCYWWRPSAKWRFKCTVAWDQIAQQGPAGQEVLDEMTKRFGPDKRNWTTPCCGANFAPWRKGASKVIEMRMADGEWKAILADRLPEQLDDEIKGVLHEWHAAAQRITPEDIMNAIPLTMPKVNKTSIPGVSRFDFTEWKRLGEPTLTQAGWVVLCKIIASKDPMNLQHILTLCDKIEVPKGLDENSWPAMMSRSLL